MRKAYEKIPRIPARVMIYRLGDFCLTILSISISIFIYLIIRFILVTQTYYA